MPSQSKCEFLWNAFNKDKQKTGVPSEIIKSYLTECQRLCSMPENKKFKCNNFLKIMKYILVPHPTLPRS